MPITFRFTGQQIADACVAKAVELDGRAAGHLRMEEESAKEFAGLRGRDVHAKDVVLMLDYQAVLRSQARADEREAVRLRTIAANIDVGRYHDLTLDEASEYGLIRKEEKR